ncbi:MAG: DUF1998 domain-containing protein, partial [Actinobacteria bacterium]|nr:DUF1998 domain-containing protein [Actinomycetota bacterium]
WRGTGYPAGRVNLRTGSATQYRILDHERDRLIGTIDESRAFDSVHPGAVYLHRGQAYEVVRLDLDERVARVVEADGGEYTQARSDTDISVVAVDEARAVGAARIHLGTVEVSTRVTGYQRRDARSRRVLGSETLDLPEQRLVTRAFWYTIDEAAMVGFDGDLGGTLHAIEHAAIGLLPLFTICDRWDVGGVSTPIHPDTGRPTIFVYDGYPGGAGIAELGWEAEARHLRATRELIEGCGCAEGCPSCVQSPKCGNGNEPLDKAGASMLLHAVLGS